MAIISCSRSSVDLLLANHNSHFKFSTTPIVSDYRDINYSSFDSVLSNYSLLESHNDNYSFVKSCILSSSTSSFDSGFGSCGESVLPSLAFSLASPSSVYSSVCLCRRKVGDKFVSLPGIPMCRHKEVCIRCNHRKACEQSIRIFPHYSEYRKYYLITLTQKKNFKFSNLLCSEFKSQFFYGMSEIRKKFSDYKSMKTRHRWVEAYAIKHETACLNAIENIWNSHFHILVQSPSSYQEPDLSDFEELGFDCHYREVIGSTDFKRQLFYLHKPAVDSLRRRYADQWSLDTSRLLYANVVRAIDTLTFLYLDKKTFSVGGVWHGDNLIDYSKEENRNPKLKDKRIGRSTKGSKKSLKENDKQDKLESEPIHMLQTAQKRKEALFKKAMHNSLTNLSLFDSAGSELLKVAESSSMDFDSVLEAVSGVTFELSSQYKQASASDIEAELVSLSNSYREHFAKTASEHGLSVEFVEGAFSEAEEMCKSAAINWMQYLNAGEKALPQIAERAPQGLLPHSSVGVPATMPMQAGAVDDSLSRALAPSPTPALPAGTPRGIDPQMRQRARSAAYDQTIRSSDTGVDPRINAYKQNMEQPELSPQGQTPEGASFTSSGAGEQTPFKTNLQDWKTSAGRMASAATGGSLFKNTPGLRGAVARGAVHGGGIPGALTGATIGSLTPIPGATAAGALLGGVGLRGAALGAAGLGAAGYGAYQAGKPIVNGAIDAVKGGLAGNSAESGSWLPGVDNKWVTGIGGALVASMLAKKMGLHGLPGMAATLLGGYGGYKYLPQLLGGLGSGFGAKQMLGGQPTPNIPYPTGNDMRMQIPSSMGQFGVPTGAVH